MRDYYEILSLDKTASSDQIKKAYRKVAMKYHPDRNPGDSSAEEKFKEAAEAYSILSDPEKKSRYDQFGHAGINQGGAGAGFHGMDINDIFSSFGDIFLSLTFIFFDLAISITVLLVIPSRKESGVGVCRVPSLSLKKIFAPVASATLPSWSNIKESVYPCFSASCFDNVQII